MLGQGGLRAFLFQTYCEGNRYEVMCHETFTVEPVASGCPGKGYDARFFILKETVMR